MITNLFPLVRYIDFGFVADFLFVEYSSRVSISPPRDEVSIAGRESVYVEANQAAGWGLSVNVLLVIVKLASGVLLGSAALIADAVNSIGDVTSSLAVRGALWVAQQDEDDDHPYGHTKAESIAGLCVSQLVVCGACLLGFETIRNFQLAPHVPGITAAVVAGLCGLVKEVLYRYTTGVSKKIGSSALRATALDHRSDALASGGNRAIASQRALPGRLWRLRRPPCCHSGLHPVGRDGYSNVFLDRWPTHGSAG